MCGGSATAGRVRIEDYGQLLVQTHAGRNYINYTNYINYLNYINYGELRNYINYIQYTNSRNAS